MFSIKNLFRKRKVTLSDTTNQEAKQSIRKLSTAVRLQLRLTPQSKFKIVENLVFQPPAVSFELSDYPGYVLRARRGLLFGERKSYDTDFGKCKSS